MHYYCTNAGEGVSELGFEKHASLAIPRDAVMCVCIGNTIGKCAIASEPSITNQQINTVIANEHNDAKFIYYLLCIIREQIRAVGLGGGAAQPIINKTKFSALDVRVPNLKVQKAVSEMLSAYDDLIENNRRRIGLLEEAARLLYREWFVYFRFPGHEHVKITNGLPEGWERKPFGEIAELHYGKALKEENRVSGPFPVYGSSGVVGSHMARLVEGPAIVVGRKGNVGSIYWSPTDFWPIDTAYFVAKEESDFWLYHALQSAGFQNTDAGVPGLNRDFAYSRKLILPPDRLRELYNGYATPMFEQRNTLESYNQKLAEARDLLLPRLMSGEIAV
jgi:type I restriction enzyme S subunit